LPFSSCGIYKSYMELTVQQQIFEQIKKSNKILILLPNFSNVDSLASGLALRLFLFKLQKDAVLVSSGDMPENLKFLPGSSEIQNNIITSKSLVISVNTSLKKLDEISYETENNKVKIFLKSQQQEFLPEDLTFEKEKLPIDLIITLDAASLNDLGPVFENHTDIFLKLPK
jgi:electron transfer flavoprotein alpha subunit